MGHDHHHHNGTGDIRLAFFLNAGFALLEIVGGLLTNSLAILSDAVHDLGDSLALGMAWYLERYSDKATDSRYSYGYRRFSVLGATISTLVLIAGSAIVIARAIPRLIHPEPAHAGGMILFAIVGIIINGIAVLRLRRQNSLNARVVAWHLWEDVLGWGAVLIMAVVLAFTDLYILDPLLSILITLYILFHVFRNLKEALSVFLQAVPDGIDVEEISEAINIIPGVCSSHHTHVWTIDGERHVLTTHVVVKDNAANGDILRIKDRIKHITRDRKIHHTTIEIEYSGEECGVSEP